MADGTIFTVKSIRNFWILVLRSDVAINPRTLLGFDVCEAVNAKHRMHILSEVISRAFQSLRWPKIHKIALVHEPANNFLSE